MSTTAVNPARAPAAGVALQEALAERGLLTPDEIRRARKVWDRLEHRGSFGSHLVDLGLVTREQLESAQTALREKLTAAEILVESGDLDPETLARAAAEADSRGIPLETHLLATGAASEDRLLRAKAYKHGVGLVQLEPAMVDLNLYRLLPPSAWQRLQALPLVSTSQVLEVAMPRIDRKPIEELASVTRRTTVARICSATAMSATLVEVEVMAGASKGPAPDPPDRSQAQDGERSEFQTCDARKAVQIVDHIIGQARRDRASDIHIEPLESKVRIRLRIDGGLVTLMEIARDQGPDIAARLKELAGCDVAERSRHQEGRFVHPDGDGPLDIGLSTYVSIFGENVVLKLLDKKVGLVGLERLGLSPAMLREFLDRVASAPDGLVLVTGPAGSGRTTTLFNAVDYCNDVSSKIISAEEPVEYVLQGMIQCSITADGVPDLAGSLRAILRQDADIIIIGELRDRETAEMAVQAALSGRKVYSTFRTEDSAGALVRLVGMGIEPFLIASTARGILAQRLLRRVCPDCSQEISPPAAELRLLGISPRDIAGYRLYSGRGCAACHMTGYRGRLGAYELLVVSEEIKDVLLERASTCRVAELCLALPGFVTLTEDAVMKAVNGLTTLSEVIRKAPRTRIRPLRQLMEKTL